MHNKRGNGLHFLIFVLLMGPLIWLSQTMHWGDTGTFVCVIVGLVGGFVLMKSGKSMTRRVKRTFAGSQKGSAADFLFEPTNPLGHHTNLQAYRQMANNRVGTWNAPQVPMMPHPQSMPVDRGRTVSPRVQVTPMPNPTTTTRLQVPPYSPHAAMQREATQRRSEGGPILQLGPGAQMYLATTLNSAAIVDAQPRRLAAPVFVEEWMRLGLGLLVVDVYGDYVNYLTPLLSEGFGFLAGGRGWSDNLSTAQQQHFIPLEETTDATTMGQSLVLEGLQMVFNMQSYQTTADAGTYLLALLTGIEQQARNLSSKPCAILVTDARPLFPANDDDCVISDIDVAQDVFDQFIQMLSHAGLPQLKHLALFLTTPTVDGMSDEALAACRLWIVSATSQEEIKLVHDYVDLSREEIEQLQDGEVLLFDAPNGTASFVHFRRTKLQIKPRALPSASRQTDVLDMELDESDTPLGETSGLKSEEKA